MYPLIVYDNKFVRTLAICVPVVGSMTMVESWCHEPASSSVLDCSLLRYSFPPSRFLEFLAGVGLCQVMRHCKGTTASSPSLATIAFIVSAVLIVTLRSASEAASSFIPSLSGEFFTVMGLASASALIWSLSKDSPISHALRHPWLVFGGEISFSIYMTHLGILVALSKLSAFNEIPLLEQFLVFVTATMLVSSVTFLLIERPFRDAVKLRLQSSRRSSSDRPRMPANQAAQIPRRRSQAP
jgi:peptidoglycan/LPS O-acetylase OafA/YrhL